MKRALFGHNFSMRMLHIADHGLLVDMCTCINAPRPPLMMCMFCDDQ